MLDVGFMYNGFRLMDDLIGEGYHIVQMRLSGIWMRLINHRNLAIWTRYSNDHVNPGDGAIAKWYYRLYGMIIQSSVPKFNRQLGFYVVLSLEF